MVGERVTPSGEDYRTTLVVEVGVWGATFAKPPATHASARCQGTAAPRAYMLGNCHAALFLGQPQPPDFPLLSFFPPPGMPVALFQLTGGSL